MNDEYGAEELEKNEPEMPSEEMPSQESYNEPGENPEVPQKKFGQEEFEKTIGNKNYYKDKQKENKSNLEEAGKKREEARKKYDDTKNKKKEAAEKKKESKGTSSAKDNKKAYKAAKKDNKKAKREYKGAKRDYKDVKRNIRNDKINNLKNKAYQVTNPIEAAKARAKNHVKEKAKNVTKKAAKKAAQATKKAAKKTAQVAAKVAVKVGAAIINFLLANPYLLAIIAIVVVIFFLILVVVVVLDPPEELGNSGVTSAKVAYNVNGVNANTNVQIVSLDPETNTYTVVDTVDLEQYIAGVALYAMDRNYDDEAMKAYIIAVRSHLLASAGTSTSSGEYIGFDKTKNVIRVKNTSESLVYWDPNSNLYRGGKEQLARNEVYIYSPEYKPKDKEAAYRVALTTNEKERFESIVSSVLGMYAVDANGNVLNLNCDATNVQNLTSIAQNNTGTENGKYTAILMNNYTDVSKIDSAEVEMMYVGDVGEFSTWKQKTKLGAPWGNVKIGTTATIDSVGCLITSISMLIAYSGVETGEITNFNPGTFATAIREDGCLSSGGGINSYYCLNKAVPDFKYVGREKLSGTNEERYQKISEYAQKGYFIVAEVRKHAGGQHWVAVDTKNSSYASWKDLYMWDPASTKTSISAKKGYKVGEFVYFSANS